MSAYTLRTGRKAHEVRNRQEEYVGSEGKNVVVLEMFCGRKTQEANAKPAPEVTCGSCAKGVRKVAV